jgi:hypothetical protein
MERDALRQTLDRLHAELEQSGPIDAALRSDLERALEEIREAVERAPRQADVPHPLRERLEELAVRFESSHPLLTDALGGVVRALAAMGI